MTYSCRECGASASLVDNVIVRSCDHTGPVLMDMGNVVLTGDSTVKERNKFFEVFYKVGLMLMGKLNGNK